MGKKMLTESLETVLNDLFENVRARGADYVGPEHLLQALLNDPACRDALAASAVEIEKLRAALDAHIFASVPGEAERPSDVQPTVAFQRILQRAVFEIQAAGQREVDSISVLRALLGESESIAVRMLDEHGFERSALLKRIGDNSRNAAHGSGSVSSGAGFPRSHRVVRIRTSESEIEKRLDALESKLDKAIADIGALAEKVSKSRRRGPRSE